MDNPFLGSVQRPTRGVTLSNLLDDDEGGRPVARCFSARRCGGGLFHTTVSVLEEQGRVVLDKQPRWQCPHFGSFEH